MPNLSDYRKPHRTVIHKTTRDHGGAQLVVILGMSVIIVTLGSLWYCAVQRTHRNEADAQNRGWSCGYAQARCDFAAEQNKELACKAAEEENVKCSTTNTSD